MSPHLQHESQLPPSESELIHSLAQRNTEGDNRLVRVSPFQVESILGIRDDKPIDLEINSVGGQDGNSMMSPQDQVSDGSHEGATHNNVHIGDAASQPKSDPLLPVPPSNFDPFNSPRIEDSSVVKVNLLFIPCSTISVKRLPFSARTTGQKILCRSSSVSF